MNARTLQATRCNGVNAQSSKPKRVRVVVRATVEAPAKISATDRVQLGQSDLMVSVCCLGTMTWGKQNTEQEAHEQLSYAFDYGLNFMDTAEMYPVPPTKDTQGLTDKYIGSWMKNQKRDGIVLATKVAGYGQHNTYLRDNGQTVRVTKDQIVESVDKSLARLGTDYIDLLQIHWPDRYVPLFGGGAYDIANEREGDIPFEEQLRGLEEVVKAGKVRYVGVSNETSYGVSEFVHAAKAAGLPRIQTIQNVYHLIQRGSFETDLAETCRRHQVSLLAYSPLAGGVLSGKYLQPHPPAEARLNLFPGYMERYNKSQARTATEEYVKVAQKHGLTPTQLALAWCRSRWFVASSIIGATSMPQLKENLEAFSISLSQEAIDDVNAVYKRFRDPPIAA